MKRIVYLIIILSMVMPLFGAEENDYPYELSVEREMMFIIPGALTYGLSYPVELHKQALTEQEILGLKRSDINVFDRAAAYNWSSDMTVLSDVGAGLVMALPAFLYFTDSVQKHYLSTLILWGETELLVAGLCSLTKSIVDRKRPYVYNPSISVAKKLAQSDAQQSFFSLHTATAFSSAVFLSQFVTDLYPDSNWRFVIWPVSLAAAAGVGVLRYTSGNHYPSDILTGAAVGSAIGFLTLYLHRKKSWNVTVVPMLGENKGLLLSYTF